MFFKQVIIFELCDKILFFFLFVIIELSFFFFNKKSICTNISIGAPVAVGVAGTFDRKLGYLNVS